VTSNLGAVRRRERARILFDELDAVIPRRDDVLFESSTRVVNTFLTGPDGLDARRGIFVLAATNWPEMLDPVVC
jgi:ribosome biogenesis ATPase